MQLDQAKLAAVFTPEINRIIASGSQLARAGRVDYYPPEHFLMGLLSSRTPVMQAVKDEFMVTAESMWARLRVHFQMPDIIYMCSKPPMTPHLKQIISDVCDAAISDGRQVRPFDLLLGVVQNPSPILSRALVEFDLTPQELGPFISAHEHLEPPKPIGPIVEPIRCAQQSDCVASATSQNQRKRQPTPPRYRATRRARMPACGMSPGPSSVEYSATTRTMRACGYERSSSL
ncbi:hypothetical protein [Lacipirellula sp.]|uniref:hypothetical protein n=1 Tax=Lacipirellula sp. TaxID=2691419 RepID=UPI003D0AA52A